MYQKIKKLSIGTLLTFGVVGIIGLMVSASFYSTYLSNKAQTIIRKNTTRIFDVLTIQRDLEELFSTTTDLDTILEEDRLVAAENKINGLHKRALDTVQDGEEREIFTKDEAEHAYGILSKVKNKTNEIVRLKEQIINKTTVVEDSNNPYNYDNQRELDQLFFSLRNTRFELLGIFHEITIRSDEQYNHAMDLVYDAQRVTWVVVGIGLGLAIVLGVFLVRSVKKVFELKNEFVNIIAHDLRNPVTAINGYLQIISSGKDKKISELKEDFQAMEVSALKLGYQINNLLEVGRTEAGHVKLSLESVDPYVLIDESVLRAKALAEFSKVKLIFEKKKDNVLISADKSKLSDVLDNLISNAIKYNKKNGVVTITTEGKGEIFSISVTDTGHGIPENQKNRIFKRYSRVGKEETKSVKGTGLGLYAAKMSMDAMKGSISFQSTENNGTTFTIEFVKVTKPSSLKAK